MTSDRAYCAIYDFELVPYALGDVLTWCVQTSIRCREAGKSAVEVFILVDEKHPAGVYQANLITAENAFLFFNELFGAFACHPMMSDIHVFTDRERLIAALAERTAGDAVNEEVFGDYRTMLDQRDDFDALIAYFLKYVYSHDKINAYAAAHGGIPLLADSRGCAPDINGLRKLAFGGKRIVVVHPRLRRLDAGYGGDHTYTRDSDFLEWYEFLKEAETRNPEVQFVVMGRLQEKPIEILRLPNVTALRALGLGLGHELTLLRRADLFIGTSSGFAAMANFTEVPYFITRMNAESCKAYAIPDGHDRLPFAAPNQFLIYEPETKALLFDLLDRGLALPSKAELAQEIRMAEQFEATDFESFRRRMLHPASTTCRFFTGNAYADRETALLVTPHIEQGQKDLEAGDTGAAAETSARIEASFPRLAAISPSVRWLRDGVAPPPQVRLKSRVRSALLSVNGSILPQFLHGSAIHRGLKTMKDKAAGYERR